MSDMPQDPAAQASDILKELQEAVAQAQEMTPLDADRRDAAATIQEIERILAAYKAALATTNEVPATSPADVEAEVARIKATIGV